MPVALSLLERIAEIQRTGWARRGIAAEDLAARFAARRQAYRDLAARHPDYLVFDWGVSPEDAARHGLVGSLDELWTLEPPTPYQDPAVYAWLQLAWRYVGLRLPHRSPWVRTLLLASAPTGEFNARAIPHGDGGAVVLEEGLVRLARRLCNALSPLLFYDKGGQLLVRTKSELARVLAESAADVDGIGQLFMDYLANGDIELPPVEAAASSPVTRAADTMFQTFIAFVIWHEVFHLEVAAGNPDAVNREVMARDAQEMIPHLKTAAAAAGLSADAAELLQTFRSQREESEADAFAMIRAAVYGSRTEGLPVTVTGAMSAMLTLESLHRILLETHAPDLADAERRGSMEDLRRGGLLAGRPHPHPRVRRMEVVNLIAALDHGVGQLVAFEAERVELLFSTVWPGLESAVRTHRMALQADTQTWVRASPDEDAHMLTALRAS